MLRSSILKGVVSEVFLSEVTFKQRQEGGEKVSMEGLKVSDIQPSL